MPARYSLMTRIIKTGRRLEPPSFFCLKKLPRALFFDDYFTEGHQWCPTRFSRIITFSINVKLFIF